MQLRKILLITTVAAIIATQACATFDGVYTGADLGYSWYRGKVTYYTTPSAISYLSLNGPLASVKIGYGESFGNDHCVYLGGEARAGYNLASKTITSVPTKPVKIIRTWNMGAAVRLGGYIRHKVRVYARLGISYDRFKMTGRATTPFIMWSLEPGLGIDRKISESVFLTAEADYARSFKTSAKGELIAPRARIITLRFGVGVKI